ncbi:MAG: DUF2946 domain-containing protein [Lysobacter sp.]|nr:MAG: DUF2946 domain-containing protein [Lysobacter sp.]
MRRRSEKPRGLIPRKLRRRRLDRIRRDMASIRRPRPWLLTLALFASVSLSLLPTLGRLYRASSPQSVAVEAFCTSRGLAWRAADTVSADLLSANAARRKVAFAGLLAAANEGGGSVIATSDAQNDDSKGDSNDTPPSGGASDDDCGYCTLTAATALPASAVTLSAFGFEPQRVRAQPTTHARPRPDIRDRSPRGPPARIAA